MTKYFDELTEEVKEIIFNYENQKEVKENTIRKLYTEENRSLIYEVIDANIILKKFLPKGKGDQDINALIDLDGIEHFPKIYAYKECEYLFMERAQGVDLIKFIEEGATEEELSEIKELLMDAFSKMLDRKRKDWDFKLEHIFWCKENKKLTWIDFSICDKHPNPFPSKKRELEEFEEHFKEELLWYGKNV